MIEANQNYDDPLVIMMKELFEKMKSLKIKMVIQKKNFFTGELDSKELPAMMPTKLFVNGAWVGFGFDGTFYRTSLISHVQEFVQWCKKQIELLKINSKVSLEWRTIQCPQNVHFYVP